MILELKDIRLSYTNARKEVFNLLDGVDLSVPEGKITALIGGNGSGKTTLFNIISGFQKNFYGEVLLNGKIVNNWPPHKISLHGVGRLFQGRQLMGDLTLMENMKVAAWDRTGEQPFYSLLHPGHTASKEKEKEEKATEILVNLFGEENKYLQMLDKPASELSYGEQRLIAMASLFMGDDNLLLLDEPTAGVNPVYIEKIKGIITRMVKDEGHTVLVIEHNMHFVRNIADICAYLDDGKILKYGGVKEVLDDRSVRNSYLGI